MLSGEGSPVPVARTTARHLGNLHTSDLRHARPEDRDRQRGLVRRYHEREWTRCPHSGLELRRQIRQALKLLPFGDSERIKITVLAGGCPFRNATLIPCTKSRCWRQPDVRRSHRREYESAKEKCQPSEFGLPPECRSPPGDGVQEAELPQSPPAFRRSLPAGA